MLHVDGRPCQLTKTTSASESLPNTILMCIISFEFQLSTYQYILVIIAVLIHFIIIFVEQIKKPV